MDFRFGAMGSKVFIFSWPNRCAAAQQATATDTNSSGALCPGPLGLGRLGGQASRRAKRECVPRPLIRPSSERPTRRCGLRQLPGSLPDPLLAVTPVGDMVKLQAALLGHDRPRIKHLVGYCFRDVPFVVDAVSQSGSLRLGDALASQLHESHRGESHARRGPRQSAMTRSRG